MHAPLPRRIPTSSATKALQALLRAMPCISRPQTYRSAQARHGFDNEAKGFSLFRTTQQVRRIRPSLTRQPHDATVPGSTTEILPLMPANTAAVHDRNRGEPRTIGAGLLEYDPTFTALGFGRNCPFSELWRGSKL